MSFSPTILDAIALIKPRITSLAIVTTAVGMYLAPEVISLKLIVLTLLGVTLLVSGASALNMFLERETDLLMERTKDRPLPQGRLTPEFGLGFGSLLVGIAIPLLFIYVNPLTGWLGIFSLLCYVMVYTHLKKVHWLALLVGAIPGAAPPLLGWTAATGKIGLPGLVLFGIIYLWQVPHFLAIGLFHKEEYAKAGLKIFPLNQNHQTIKWQMILFSIPLIPVSWMLYSLHFAGKLYLAVALGFGLLFLVYVLWGLIAKDEKKWGKQVFAISLLYLTSLFVVLFADGGR
jgi:heme o synthase